MTTLPPVPYQERPQMLEAVAAIREASSIALFCHINPDGDTLGSMLALGLALEQLGKTVTLCSADGVPDILLFLPAVDRVQRTPDQPFDLAVVLDAGEISRIGGKNREIVEAAPLVMDIDHHVTPGAFGQIRLLDAYAAATGEIVYDLLLALNASLTPQIAQCLLCGLLTDTGSFRFMNVTPRTMAIAGTLIAHGGQPNTIAEAVFENKPFAAQKLLGRALESLQRTEDGRVVWAHVTLSDFAEFEAGDADTEGVINSLRSIRGAEVAIFLREMPDGKLRVSLRARSPYNVSSVALRFGGGGHRLASGCTLEGPLETAEALLVAAVQEAMALTERELVSESP